MYSTQSYNHCKDYIVNDLTELKLLLAEIDRLTADRDSWKQQAMIQAESLRLSNVEVERLTAENERLRDELRYIAIAKPSTWDESVRDQFQEWAQSRARYALNPEEKP